jgi:hypothetical protein
MPPKKQVTAIFTQKPLDVVKYPVNEVKFTVTLDCTHEGGHNIRLKYDWFQSQDLSLVPLEVDTGLFREWTLIKTEGEEPVV